jgi:hypothetical protein
MLGDIYTGIFNYNGSSLVSPSCPTGDCLWNSSSALNVTSYASLGVCGKCQDSTASLQKSCATWPAPTMAYTNDNDANINITSPYCNYTLPNGLSLAGNSVFPSIPLIATSGEVVNSTQFQHLANPFSILSIIRGDWTNRYENGTESDDAFDGDLAASYLNNATSTECALYHCVRLYNAAVVNGTFKEEVVEIYQNDTVDSSSAEAALDYYNSFQNYTLTIPSSWHLDNKAARTFNVTHYGWQGAYQQFKKMWLGSVTAQSTSSLNTNKSYSSDTIQTIFGLNSTGVQHTIGNLAQSMTNNIRQSSGQTSPGIAYQSLPYVVVIWAWMALPVLLLVIAFVLLASTIFRTKRKGTQLWKTSSLAAFYHPLTETGRERVGRAIDNRHLEKIAEDVHVKWARTEKGWRFIAVEGAEECRKVV